MKEAEQNDPMELVCKTIPGDPVFVARCVIEEFASLGYEAEDLFTLFREPVYPMLNSILAREGEAGVRSLIDQVLMQRGRLRVKTELVHSGRSGCTSEESC